MGLLDDIQKGLGFKDRDKDYYDSTAKSIGRQRGGAAEARYRDTTGLSSGGNIGSPGMPQRGGLLSGMRFGEYRDMNDMFDRGGPDASGGKFEGGGLLSGIANLLTKRTPIIQTEGYGNSAKILGERTNSSGLSRPFNIEFHNTYRAALDNNLIPGMTTYDDYYEMMFP
jgi:hypothetical protein